MIRRQLIILAGLLAIIASTPAQAAGGKGADYDALLEKVRTGQIGNRAERERKVADFRRKPADEQQRLLEAARARHAELQAASLAMEETARADKKLYTQKITELRSTLGPNAAMFGILQQTATDLIGIFRNSPTSLQYPDRGSWLTGFVERMEQSSAIFSIRDIEKLWFLLQQEITAASKIERVPAEVISEEGSREQRELVRIGKFNLVANEPDAAYLSWQADNQRASVLKRQPEGDFLGQVDDYVDAESGMSAVGIDPTGGSLLTRLVDAPSMGDRVAQGGRIGYLILLLGLVGVAIALYKLADIAKVSAKVTAQRRKLDQPSDDNPLGRMLKIYETNKNADIETLEMRLGEAILEERPKVDRFVGIIKVISAVAPLMGLMGTVIGMIATFQAITLFGTGDPKTMAGGISQALVTTVLGLTVAIPTVLLHAVVSSRAASVVNTLKHQTAGLIAQRMEARKAQA